MIPHVLEIRQSEKGNKPFSDLLGQAEMAKLHLRDPRCIFDDTLSFYPAAGAAHEQEKCIAARTHDVLGIATAAIEMNAVATRNTRCRGPAFHFILSWPAHEHPESNAIFDAAEHAIKSLGMSDHQFVIVIQSHTDNIHCRVVVNRIHPVTYKSHNVAWSKKTLHFAARESEIKHGWSHDNGTYIVEQDSNDQKRIVPNKNRVDEHMP